MKQYSIRRQLTVALALSAMVLLPLSALAQTRVTMPKNKYKVQDDVKIGNDASRQVEQQFPILNDRQTQAYVERVGERLVAAIPAEFQQPAFDYKFEVVNARDINAFALPGGPMYVNRGMIEASKNEGEMAGVMAHEISHVALRHATAQQTKASNPWNQILMGGAILGGAILGGGTGAQLGQMIAAGSFLRYSRDYETQADILGARIMADAGYDPRDLANMFKTIAGEGGGRGPEWLSSHPDPGNRFQKINQEAGYLNVSPNPIKITQEFSRTKERLSGMPRAQSMAEIEKNQKAGGNTTSPTANGRYTNSVPMPSTRYRTYQSGSWMRMNVPSNWEEFAGQSDVTFAPEGAYGNQGITHGAMVGLSRSRGGSFDQATRDYIDGLVQSNSYLRQQGGFTRATIAGRQAYVTTLGGRSPVTGRNETVTVYTVPMRSGDLLYIAAVAPTDDAYRYNSAFRTMIGSVRLSD